MISKIIILMSLIFILMLMGACAPRETPITSEVKEAVVAAPPPEAEWKDRWEEILKRARREGRIVIYGPPIAEVRRAFAEEFPKAYPGIMVDYTGLPGALLAPKLISERRAGLHIVDLHLGGTTTGLTVLREFLKPIKPLLILPEVLESKAWWDGRLDFADKEEELILVFTINVNSRLIYNSLMVDPSEITSWWDLTKPKFKEKITMWDPRIAGNGQVTSTFWYFNPELGLDYIRSFAANKPVLTRDLRLQVEQVSRGRFSLGAAPSSSQVNEFKEAGMPIKWAPVLKEGTFSGVGFGAISVVDRAPHPNAATIFLNWFLGKEGQTLYARGAGYASRRLDVPVGHLVEEERPNPGLNYMPLYKEEKIMMIDEIVSHLKRIFKDF